MKGEEEARDQLKLRMYLVLKFKILFTFSYNLTCILVQFLIYEFILVTFNELHPISFVEKCWTIQILLTFDATTTGLLCLIASAPMAL